MRVLNYFLFVLLLFHAAIADPLTSHVKIFDLDGNPLGSGFLYKGYVATAYHVVDAKSSEYLGIFYDGEVRILHRSSFNESTDAAVLVSPGFDLNKLDNFSSSALPVIGEALYFIGASKNPFHSGCGVALSIDTEKILTSFAVIPGDSGGSVINEDDKPVGFVHGYRFKVVMENGKRVEKLVCSIVFPISSIDSLIRPLEDVKDLIRSIQTRHPLHLHPHR